MTNHTPADVMQEVRGNLERALASGMNTEQVREFALNGLQAVHDETMVALAPQIASDPDFALFWLYQFNQVLGMSNEVIYKEYGLTPVYIREIKCPVAELLEELQDEYTLEELLLEADKAYKGGLN